MECSRFKLWLETLCCVLRKDTILSVPLSTQVYNWVQANFMLGVTLQWTSIPSVGGGGGVGVEILLVASCYVNRDMLRPDGPLGSYTDFKLHTRICIRH